MTLRSNAADRPNHLSSTVLASMQQKSARHRLAWIRLGSCLGGIGVLSSTIAQAQTVAPTPVAIPNGATVEQALSNDAPSVMPGTASTRAADLQPETISSMESAEPTPPETALQVPEATVESAPRTATEGNTEYTPPAEIVVTERSPQPASSPKAQPNPANNSKKGTATATNPGQKVQPPSQKVTPQQQTAPNQPLAVVVPEVVPQAAAPEPAVRLGPISFSSAGISVAPSAIQPYLNPNLRRTPMAGLETLRMMFPVAIPAPITSLFGWRIHPISGSQRMHTGTDIGAPSGTPVLATLAGRVILADSLGGYGITVALEHDNGMRQTLYAHLSELFVRPGDVVQQGTVIGRVGSTGASTGPHLHFEMRQMLPDGTWVAQDAGKSLELAMNTLVQSLQIAQQPQQQARLQSPRSANSNQYSTSYPTLKTVR
jgi:murein DD-endopeptidase MepM/ murein hydrolase activator NlpD